MRLITVRLLGRAGNLFFEMLVGRLALKRIPDNGDALEVGQYRARDLHHVEKFRRMKLPVTSRGSVMPRKVGSSIIAKTIGVSGPQVGDAHKSRNSSDPGADGHDHADLLVAVLRLQMRAKAFFVGRSAETAEIEVLDMDRDRPRPLLLTVALSAEKIALGKGTRRVRLLQNQN